MSEDRLRRRIAALESRLARILLLVQDAGLSLGRHRGEARMSRIVVPFARARRCVWSGKRRTPREGGR